MCFEAGGFSLQCFDIASTKEKQYGFRTTLPDGKKLVCLGDEPYNELNHDYVAGADWLLCEAFCLHGSNLTKSITARLSMPDDLLRRST